MSNLKVFYLATCSTCSRILKELTLPNKAQMIEIKSEGISLNDLDAMQKLTGNYEALFSRKAMKYRTLGLHEKTLSEQDYRQLIHKEYTFLKRPVFLFTDRIFVGNTKAEIERLKAFLNEK